LKNQSKLNLIVFQTADEFNKAAAEFIVAIASKSIAARGRFVVSLSGGKTPQKLYSLLAELPFRNQIEWGRTFVFWGDERCVPLDDARNNAYQAKIFLLDKVNIPKTNIFSIPVNLSPEEAAIEYENEIKNFFGDEPMKFDLFLLGLGENGHTASLFPGTNVIDEQSESVRDVYVEEEKMFRITITAPLINRASTILFLVTGKNKAEMLRKVLELPYQPDKIPAQLIKPIDGELYWFVDQDAATLI
jgi:6-phosphogluconolactonase